VLSPVERINTHFNDDDDANKEEFSRLKAIITEMLLKAIPQEIVTEAVQKRYDNPTKVTLLIMIKYQPGSQNKRKRSCSKLAVLKLVGQMTKRSPH
jgi:hypothetical protein